jgi:hypothetical protein
MAGVIFACRLRTLGRGLRAAAPRHAAQRRGLSTPNGTGPGTGGGPGPSEELTSGLGIIIKFGFALSMVATVFAYGPKMDLGMTNSALVLASAKEPFFQLAGSRRLRVYANDKRKCAEVVKNGAIELLCEHLGSEDRQVREEATATIEALCRGPCALEAHALYERAITAVPQADLS